MLDLNIEGMRLRASTEALRCDFEQDTIFFLVLVQAITQAVNDDTTEKMLTGT